MATRYMIAMDHVDLHAREVMRKYAKRRPLGDIESRHRYTTPQPVLSCRTVDVDATGTRTYRPRSSQDIIQEQHRLIHDVYTKARNVSSAPAVRRVKSGSGYHGYRQTDDSYKRLQRINVEVHGRPATSFSETNSRQLINSGSRPQTSVNRKRPKTAGSSKKPKSTGDFMVLKVDPDIILSSRVQKELTNKIREQWGPENHDLTEGRFVRGQRSGADSPGRGCQWLTFAGSHNENAQGIVDAFVCKTSEERYSIDGVSGIRVAQQLSRGDPIRIGVNGAIRSEDFSIRETTFTRSGSRRTMKKAEVVPLCWSEQVSWPKMKVLQAREPVKPRPQPNLCETHQVVFKKLIPDEPARPKLACGKTTDSSYKVKTRSRRNTAQSYQTGTRASITDITIDHYREDDSEVDNISVDKIFEKCLQNKTSPRPVIEVTIQDNGARSSPESQSEGSKNLGLGAGESQAARADNANPSKPSGTGKQEGAHIKAVFVKPSPPSFLMNTNPDPELSISVPGGKPLEPQMISPRPSNSKTGFNKRTTAVSGLTFENASPKAEFIHFSTGLVNPNPRKGAGRSPCSVNRAMSQVKEHNHTPITTDLLTSSRRKYVPERETVVSEDMYGDVEKEQDGLHRRTNTPVSPLPLASSFAINIPTADLDKLDRTSSILSSRNLTPDSAIHSTGDIIDRLNDAAKFIDDPGKFVGAATRERVGNIQELAEGTNELASNVSENDNGLADNDMEQLVDNTGELVENDSEQLTDLSNAYRSTDKVIESTDNFEEQEDDDDNDRMYEQPVHQDMQRDSQIEQIASLLGESLRIPNQFNFSSSQSDSSSSRQSDTSDTVPVTNKSQLRVTFKAEPEFSQSMVDYLESLPQASIKDLLSNPASPGLDASIEVRRLRQQIKNDLHKAQEETESDIEYLKMRRSKPFT